MGNSNSPFFQDNSKNTAFCRVNRIRFLPACVSRVGHIVSLVSYNLADTPLFRAIIQVCKRVGLRKRLAKAATHGEAWRRRRRLTKATITDDAETRNLPPTENRKRAAETRNPPISENRNAGDRTVKNSVRKTAKSQKNRKSLGIFVFLGHRVKKSGFFY